jgi:GDPmannose 4,6-dehydratase
VGLKQEDFVRLDERYLRPTEVDLLIGDPAKAKKQLNWKPRVTFKELVKIMLVADLEAEGLDPKKYQLQPSPKGIRP